MIEIYKYGGTLLKDENIRKEIYKFLKSKKEQGIKVIMVVSAFGREKDSFSTDNLSKNIELLSDLDKDQIMTFGEIYSSLIIKNELLKEGFKVNNLYYDEIGIMCDNNYQDGNIKHVDMSYLKEQIELNDIVVVPGFIGESSDGKVISLGRNTSDLTAIVIADYLNINKAYIIKEVDGVYKKDPKKEKTDKIIPYLSYNQMLSLIKAGSKIFCYKSIKYAKNKGVTIEIKGLNSKNSTVISEKESNENILLVDIEEDKMHVVFKNMELFNELFKTLVEQKIKLDDLVIVKDIIYIRGNIEKVSKIIEKYL